MAKLKGTWVFNDSIYGDGNTYNVNFTYNGIACTKISGLDNPTSSIPIHTASYLWFYTGGNWLKVYQDGWLSPDYKTIVITEEPENEGFSEWLPNNAIQQVADKTPTLSIDLSTLNLPVGTHTIAVRGKASGYLDSAVSASVVITVEPEVTTEVGLQGGDLYILDTAGTAQSFDIVVDGVVRATAKIGEVNCLASLISFTIDGTTYQAEEGMTWGEWVESDYNTGGYATEGSYNIKQGTSGAEYLANSSGDFVTPSDTIISGHTYSMQSSGEPA